MNYQLSCKFSHCKNSTEIFYLLLVKYPRISVAFLLLLTIGLLIASITVSQVTRCDSVVVNQFSMTSSSLTVLLSSLLGKPSKKLCSTLRLKPISRHLASIPAKTTSSSYLVGVSFIISEISKK